MSGDRRARLQQVKNGMNPPHPDTPEWALAAIRDLIAMVEEDELDLELLRLWRDDSVRPTIACLCGSTRQAEEFAQLNAKLTLEGKIVLSVGVFGAEGADKPGLDTLHLRKIDLADEVHFIVKPDGTFGGSTGREFRYAGMAGKRLVIHH